MNCSPTDPLGLWDHFKDQLCDDVAHQSQHRNIQTPTSAQIHDFGLHLIDRILMRSGKRLHKFPPMPLPQHNWDEIQENHLLAEQLDYNTEEMQQKADECLNSFNPEQRAVFDAAMDSCNNSLGKMFFIHSAGGGGKTYVANALAAANRAQGKVVLCVASSGIASLILDGGRTSHSQFKIPLNINESSTCSIKKGTLLHGVLSRTVLIIWDEAPMARRFTFEAVDRTLRDILENDSPFGGITVVFGGDFRQTLPVIVNANREEIVGASIRRSPLWSDINMMYLRMNMRLERNTESEGFATWLLHVGAGRHLDADKKITLPPDMRCGNNAESLITSVYPDIEDQLMKPDIYFLNRTILSPKNVEVTELNNSILAKTAGEERVYFSADSISEETTQEYSTEFLNSLSPSGLPHHRITLKPGCPLMLLRNLDAAHGLCNGTRLRLLECRRRVLKCRVLKKDGPEQIVMIPRITLEPTTEDLPIPLKRRQFPVRLAYAMTINKSQGQSVKYVGIDLRTPVFSHGQLYVALSRCTSKDRIKVLFPEAEQGTKTPNVVYPEALTGLEL